MKHVLTFETGRDLVPVDHLWNDLPRLSVDEVRSHLPMTASWAYLDSAATSLTPTPIWEEMAKYFLAYNANVERGAYFVATYATDLMRKALSKVAELLLGCERRELLFTRNMTEGMNWVAASLEGTLCSGANIVVSDVEHHSNLLPWIRLARRNQAELRVVPTQDGVIDPGQLATFVDARTALVSVQHASNVTGVVQNVEAVAQVCKDAGALLAVDGSQGPGHMKVNVKRLGCDYYSFSGHKGPMGPTGTGGLYVRAELLESPVGDGKSASHANGRLGIHEFCQAVTYVDVDFLPMLVGGGVIADVDYDRYVLTESPSRYMAGTPDVPAAIALGRAAVYVAEQIGLDRVSDREAALSARLLEGLLGTNGVDVYGPKDTARRTGLVSFNVHGHSSVEVARILDLHGICTRAGVHCVTPWHKRHALVERTIGSVRASVHYYTTEGEIEQLLSLVREVARGASAISSRRREGDRVEA